MQERSNSNALPMELRLSCINTSIWNTPTSVKLCFWASENIRHKFVELQDDNDVVNNLEIRNKKE